MKLSQYDTIAEQYAETQDKRLNRVYNYEPSFLEVAGNLVERTVFDMACGDGRMTRQAVARGAVEVTGVDLSPEMIKLAQEKGGCIDYFQGRVGKLGPIAKFDQVWGTFLLHYAETKEELEAMAEDIAINLRTGGKFVAFNQNPLCPFSKEYQYGTTVFPEGPLFEGQRIKVTLWDGDKEGASFVNYHWNISTYNQALTKAGLKDIVWHPTKVSSEGIAKFGKEFWDKAYQYPTVNIIEARKGEAR